MLRTVLILTGVTGIGRVVTRLVLFIAIVLSEISTRPTPTAWIPPPEPAGALFPLIVEFDIKTRQPTFPAKIPPPKLAALFPEIVLAVIEKLVDAVIPPPYAARFPETAL
jgi:hypothetical protein